MKRRTVGLSLVGGFLALVGVAVACGPSTAWPPTVESGQGGGEMPAAALPPRPTQTWGPGTRAPRRGRMAVSRSRLVRPA